MTKTKSSERKTLPVSDGAFKRVYDSPASLPGRHKWLTADEDVRSIEEILGMPPGTIGAPLWVSGDRKTCKKCRRQISWLDIVTSALDGVHERKMVAQVILGEQKFVNTEVPRAIAGLKCHDCGTPFDGLRSFKCHNWAYANAALVRVLEKMKGRRRPRG